jgi:hypothetical protein
MGETFRKFKRKAFGIRLAKSLMAGLALGLAIFGACHLLLKFEVIPLTRVKAILIAAGAGALLGVLLFLLLRVTDRRLARQLDEQYRLSEKVRTMLEFGDKEGAIYELQRRDTEESLAAIRKKRVKFKRLWLYILCLVLGGAVFAASFFFSPPPPEEPPVVPPEPFAITDMQIAAMEELIAYVKSSEMESPYRENVAASLSTLLDELRAVTNVNERDEALSKAVDAIHAETDASSTAVELMNELWKCDAESTQLLARTLNYYEWPKADEWDKFNSRLTDFRTSLRHAGETAEETTDETAEKPDPATMLTDTKMLLTKIGSHIPSSLTRSGISPEDSLSVVLTRLASANETTEGGSRLYGLTVIAAGESYDYSGMQRELDATVATLNGELYRSLSRHKANTGTGEYAMTRLAELFGCTLPAFERPQFFGSDEDSGTIGDDSSGGVGGIGSGTEYGSDDLVYDPYTNSYVEYGTILDKYYALMFGKLQGDEYTEEEKKALEKYFEILYGGFDEEETE